MSDGFGRDFQECRGEKESTALSLPLLITMGVGGRSEARCLLCLCKNNISSIGGIT